MTTRTKILLALAILLALSIPYWDYLRAVYYIGLWKIFGR